ncbi:MAG: acyl-homoserine-lactone synthase [Maritimibacter sp.]
MQTTTLSFANLHNYGELFANVLRARRETFIVRNKWDLPEADGMEFDQYDTPASRWVAVHARGKVLAGVRLTPTTARCGIYSYMIRDAQLGLLGDIPSTLLYGTAPVAANVWESSRVFVDPNIAQRLRRPVHLRLIREMVASSRAQGAVELLALIPATWPRWLSPLGLDVSAAGPVLEIAGTRNQAVSINLAEKLH